MAPKLNIPDNKSEEFQEWLKTLVPGKLVAVIHGGTYNSVTVLKVNRITPSGRIILGNDSYTFLPNGNQYGRSGYYSNFLSPYTKGIKNFIEYNNALARINEVKWHKLSTETLKAVLEALSPESAQEEKQ